MFKQQAICTAFLAVLVCGCVYEREKRTVKCFVIAEVKDYCRNAYHKTFLNMVPLNVCPS